MDYTINKVKTVVYVAINFEVDLTDLTLTIRRPNGTIFDTIILSEQTGGVYTAAYTPDALGSWQEKVTSVVNGDKVVRSYDVKAFDADDVKSQTQSIENKVDVIDSNVDSVKSTVEATASDVDSIKAKTDNLPANTTTTLQNIQDSVDNITATVNPGGYFA